MEFILKHTADKKKPADLFVMGYFEGGAVCKELQTLEPLFYQSIKTALKNGKFKGSFSETLSSYHEKFTQASEIVLIGLGKTGNFKKLCMRKAAGQIAQLAKSKNVSALRILTDSFAGGEVKIQDAVSGLAEVLELNAYAFDKYKKDNAKKKKEFSTELIYTKKQYEAAFKKNIAATQAVTRGVLLARDLINEPGNVLNAPRMVEIVRKMTAQKKISCKVLGEAELKKLKMNGILAVNQGSMTPPALIVTEYGQRYQSKGTVCLVGKGVTFDTGGISLKPGKDMEKMKYDMSGSAAVIGAMSALADLGLPVHVVALTPMVENNVANNPQRPGDIIQMYNGKTVEVINTDAEGRLILADALSYAEKFKPKAIIDLATLTGMCAYTFGDQAIAILGNSKRLIGRVQDAGEAAGERCWELPMWDGYRDQIKGYHSDLLNVGGPYGGTITAAKFLEEFIPEKTDWVHMDIAGTAWCNSPRYDCVKGATGVGVKLLVQFLKAWKK
ncbi:MAG: leucyl aminopeptidase [Candidatus Omnitrophica bacterium]|nr:leucyl aminopeptidase [Candidatus Omnitrophota bacterium]